MRTRMRRMLGVLIVAVFCCSVCEVSVFAKKKPKRRRARTVAEQTTPKPFVLLSVTPSVPAIVSKISTPITVTPPPVSEARPEVKAPQTPSVSAGQLIISEFRLRGPGLPGNAASVPFDEFIEIYNASGANHTVASISGSGYGIAASDGVTRCTIPNGEVIPAKGHWLCANTTGYSLSGYPEDNPAGPNASYTNNDIPDNTGIALFNNSTGGASYSLANRLDAVGSTSEANTLYREGAGYPPLSGAAYTAGIDYSFVRDTCGKGGSLTILGPCTAGAVPKDTDNNAVDFFFIDTNATNAGAGQRLGAPGPQANNGPIERNSAIIMTLLDTCTGSSSVPNRVRNPTPVTNGAFGTMEIRKTITNNTSSNIQRLRFRIVDLTTSPPSPGFADLRALTSADDVVTVDRPPCGSGSSNVTLKGTTLESRFLFSGPAFQPNGGGFNSVLFVQLSLISPLPPFDDPSTPTIIENQIDVRFLLGVQQTGNFKFYVNAEIVP